MVVYWTLTNGISDEWYNACHASSYSIFQTIYSSFSLLFHFDSLNWVVLELLILLPVFFRLYGFGIQQKLTKFYNKVRLQLITFLFYFSFTTVLSCIIHFLLPQNAACAKWDGVSLTPFRSDFMSPSSLLILVTLFFLMFFDSEFGYGLIVSSLFGIFFIGATVSSILCGSASILQATISISIGAWFYFMFSFLPLICMPIFIAGAFLISLYLFVPILVSPNSSDYFLRYCALPGVRASILLLFSMFLIIQFASSYDDFKWTKLNWEGLKTYGSHEDSVAMIPGIIRIFDEDVFGKRLLRDIIFSSIAFIAVLMSNVASNQLFNYRIYDFA